MSRLPMLPGSAAARLLRSEDPRSVAEALYDARRRRAHERGMLYFLRRVGAKCSDYHCPGRVQQW
jgi:hypothetical protein